MRKWILPASLSLLSLLSIVTLRSVAPRVAAQQLIYVLTGLSIFYFTARWPFAYWYRWRWIGFVGLGVLLAIPLVFGFTDRGIKAWIDIGPWFSIQPSQLAIPIVSLALAGWLDKRGQLSWFEWMVGIGIIAIPGVLIALEPDLGTLIVYAVSLGALLFVAGIPWKLMGLLGGSALVGLTVAWLFLFQPYQKNRILSFVNPDLAGDTGYNAQQALIAVGSGQWFGRGVGQGVQSHLRFLPERQTDFIFASLAEEWGFMGSLMVLGLYVSIVGICLWLGWKTTQLPVKWFVVSAAVMLAVQITINIGMNMHLMPITGITLPWLSYGGSSFLSLCWQFGIIQGLVQAKTVQTARHFS